MPYVWLLLFVATAVVLATGSWGIRTTSAKKFQAERFFHVVGYAMLTFTGCLAFPVVYLNPLILVSLAALSTLAEYLSHRLRWVDIAGNWFGILVGYIAVVLAAYVVAITD